MGTAMMILAALGGLVGTIAIGLLKDEATAWLPWLHRRILAAALQQVPPDQRERYSEEWASHVAEYPGKLSQLWQCLRCLRAGSTMHEITDERFSRLMATFVAVNGATFLTDLWFQKWSSYGFWTYHLLSFLCFASTGAYIYCVGWAIWMKPSVSRAIERARRG